MGFWGRIIRTLLAIESHVSSASSTQRAFRPRGRKLCIEGLEDRALLTVTASFVDGQLSVASDWR
ncbi:MAG: hypothetical protein K2Y37_22870, partial [Pirellulales bacterium]|nr:hypothetical protein [Pirellulales bacterium]